MATEQQKGTMVPKLRFPEFEGEWKISSLGHFLTFKNGINASKEQYGKGVAFINVLDIIENDFITYGKIIGRVDIDEAEFSKNEVAYGDILFQRSSETREEVGLANVYLDHERKATFGGFVIRGKKIGEYEPIFMNFLLRTASPRKEITSKSGGSTRYNVGQEVLKGVKVALPSLPEQQKIAAFLTAVDNRIAQLSRKVELLEAYKKGVMQRIFSRELRFKDEEGKAFPEWEEVELGEVFDFISTNSLSRKHLNYESGGVKNIHYGDIHSKYQSNFFVEDEEVPYITDPDNYRSIREECFCREGDLVIADASEDHADIGKSIEIIELDEYPLVAGLHTILVRDTGNRTVLGFKGYIMQSWPMRHQMMRVATGISVLGLSKTNLGKVKFWLPCLEEQRKIVHLLQRLDGKIYLSNHQLVELREFKKGLLQGMFI